MFFLTQIGWILFSIIAGPEEAAWSWPFRNLNEIDQFKKEDKDKQSLLAHRFGWFSVVVIGIIVSLLITKIELGGIDIGYSSIFVILLAFEYSVAFDGSYGVAIGKNIFYIGNTAKTDNAIGNAGKAKFIICIAAIIILNIILLNY